MSQKLIIFDMDGTLVNSSITIANAINYVRKKISLPPMSQQKILSLVNDHTINPARQFYESDTFMPQYEKWFTEYYSRHHQNELELYEGIKELLETLKKRAYLLAIATNAYRASTIETLTHLEIDKYFNAIACYDDVAKGKPHPDMLYKLLDDLGQSHTNSLFVGDGPRDEMAAKAAKIEYKMVDWGFTEHTQREVVISVDALKKSLLGEL